MPATKTRRPRPSLTAEEIAARDQARIDKLDRALAALRTEQGWGAWLSSRKAFRTYSLNNQLLIAQQAPDAKRVAGFKAWLALGYCVRKGEKAIGILGPIRKKDPLDGNKEKVVGFKMVPVFHDGQVDPIPGVEQAPLSPPAGVLTGTAQVGEVAPLIVALWDGLLASGFARHIVFEEPVNVSAGGWFVPRTRSIILVPTGPLALLRVLVHEGGHAILNDQGLDLAYGTEEGIVEAATFLVLDGLGVENTESPAYIEGWNSQDPDLVKRDAQLILDLAKTIEGMLAHEDQAA